MIPLRDLNPTRTRPVVTHALIAANVLIFIFQAALSEKGAESLLQEYALKPSFFVGYLQGKRTAQYPITIVEDARGIPFPIDNPHEVPLTFWNSVFPLLTSMFLHGGLLHILGNMWFLHIFGDNVEDRLGHGLYVLFYLATGVTGSLTQVLASPGSSLPMIGASGAISGVLGAYAITYPTARVLSLVPVFLFFPIVELPAIFFLFIWFGFQLLTGLFGGSSHGGGVAVWAHIA